MGFANDDGDDDGDDDDDDDDDIEGDYDKDAGNMAAWDMPKSPYDAVFRKRVGGLGGTPLKYTGLEDLNKNPEAGTIIVLNNSTSLLYSLLLSPVLLTLNVLHEGLDTKSGHINALTGKFSPGKISPPKADRSGDYEVDSVDDSGDDQEVIIAPEDLPQDFGFFGAVKQRSDSFDDSFDSSDEGIYVFS